MAEMSTNDPPPENQNTPKDEGTCKAAPPPPMQNVQWPDTMPEEGRLPESKAAAKNGKVYVADCHMSCEQTMHVSIFFDGTNNNDAQKKKDDDEKDDDEKDDENNEIWRDSKTQKHTNIARLYNAAIEDKAQGIFRIYIPGVGTPFPEIGEELYDQDGKAMATGFDPRCVWAYTSLLNAVLR